MFSRASQGNALAFFMLLCGCTAMHLAGWLDKPVVVRFSETRQSLCPIPGAVKFCRRGA